MLCDCSVCKFGGYFYVVQLTIKSLNIEFGLERENGNGLLVQPTHRAKKWEALKNEVM